MHQVDQPHSEVTVHCPLYPMLWPSGEQSARADTTPKESEEAARNTGV